MEQLVVARETAETESELDFEKIADEMLPQFATLVQVYNPDPDP